MPKVEFQEQLSAVVKVRGVNQATAPHSTGGIGPTRFPDPPVPPPPPLVVSIDHIGMDPTSDLSVSFDRPARFFPTLPNWTILENPSNFVSLVFVQRFFPDTVVVVVEFSQTVNPGDHVVIAGGGDTFTALDGGVIADQSIVLQQ